MERRSLGYADWEIAYIQEDYDSGHSFRQLNEDYGVGKCTLYKWAKLGKFKLKERQRKKSELVELKESDLNKKCNKCGTETKKTRQQVERYKVFYCSKECQLKDAATWRPKDLWGRSKTEEWIEDHIRYTFSSINLITNDRETCSGLELDFYFPDLQLAIEINGPTHYKPIFNTEDYEKVKKRDIRKYSICESKGIELIVVPTIGRITKKSKQEILSSLEDTIRFVLYARQKPKSQSKEVEPSNNK